jgi:hypothetical protein
VCIIFFSIFFNATITDLGSKTQLEGNLKLHSVSILLFKYFFGFFLICISFLFAWYMVHGTYTEIVNTNGFFLLMFFYILKISSICQMYEPVYLQSWKWGIHFYFKKTLEEKFTHLMAGKQVDFFTIFLQMFFF